jgi:uncharacterized protein
MVRRDRRLFLKTSTAGLSAALFSVPALARHLDLEKEQTKQPQIRRRLGATGIELPVVSMGVMRADNPGLVRAALEAGMTHLDTAHGYQRGKNEQMLGEVLSDYPRESFVIATKIPPEGKEGFLGKLDISLERLKMRYVDILYLHGVSSRDGALEQSMVDTLKEIKASGKAKHIGLSTHKNEPEVLMAAAESGVYEVVLTSVNFKQDHYPEVKKAIGIAAAAGIGIVAMKTMAGAYLDKEKTKLINCRAALKWVLQDEHVTTAIPGITSYEMLADNAAINHDLTLTEREKADLAGAKGESGLYCQACGHCDGQCGNGLPIPDLMRSYMYTYGYRDAAQARSLLTSLRVPSDPCSGCSTCSVRCAKGFPVRERITDVARLTGVPEEFLV